ncbi:HAMP domain-containing sensor histidine kinase [Sphingobium sp. AN558]|uniref:sensor histidine kinase n=1 Tax=Sphingobium sp. AN558 TaxID=3133442 RepID=UPI0030C2B65F
MQTVLAAEDRSGLGAVTLWRQCVDLLAQHDRHDRASLLPEDRNRLVQRLADLRPKLSETQRIATVVELGRQLRSPALVQFFANDRPSIAAAAIARAQLPDALWIELLPHLTPTARGVLRGRRDIGSGARQALEAFGATDLVLTTDPQMGEASDMLLTPDMAVPDNEGDIVRLDIAKPAIPVDAAPPPPAGGGQNQIRNLVDRIERFTNGRRPPGEAVPHVSPVAVAPRAFTFETDASGSLIWVEDAPRAALIGLTLGEVAIEGGSGPDGHVAGAFARRSGFQNGRFAIVGGVMDGEWRMSATPFFDPRSGRFEGYRGQARRPHLHEVAATPPSESVGITGLSADSLRQLVHELRTPLNAILGFAEIIEQQLFGEAGPEYRDMAGRIATDARHLLTAFDDLDLAARVSRGDDQGTPSLLDPALLVTHVVTRFGQQDNADHTPIDIAIAPNLPSVNIDPVQGERMVQHLIRTLISVSSAGEGLHGACWFQPDGGRGRVVLAIDRPASLVGMEEAQLLDPGYTPEGDWADGPLLGLGFSLRLIRSLATGAGGALDIETGRFLLAIPAAQKTEDAAGRA